jgi:hypothetical protein
MCDTLFVTSPRTNIHHLCKQFNMDLLQIYSNTHIYGFLKEIPLVGLDLGTINIYNEHQSAATY